MNTLQMLNCNKELGEVVCNKCKGEGSILHHKFDLMDYMCPKCQGKGKLDWISNIMWKNNRIDHGNLEGLSDDDHIQYFL